MKINKLKKENTVEVKQLSFSKYKIILGILFIGIIFLCFFYFILLFSKVNIAHNIKNNKENITEILVNNSELKSKYLDLKNKIRKNNTENFKIVRNVTFIDSRINELALID